MSPYIGSREDGLVIAFSINARILGDSIAAPVRHYLETHTDLPAERVTELDTSAVWEAPSAWPINRECFLRIYRAAKSCFPVSYEEIYEGWLNEVEEVAMRLAESVVVREYRL